MCGGNTYRTHVCAYVCVCACVCECSVGHALMKSTSAFAFAFFGQRHRRRRKTFQFSRPVDRLGGSLSIYPSIQLGETTSQSGGPWGRCPGERNHAQRRIHSPRICLSKADNDNNSSKWTLFRTSFSARLGEKWGSGSNPGCQSTFKLVYLFFIFRPLFLPTHPPLQTPCCCQSLCTLMNLLRSIFFLFYVFFLIFAALLCLFTVKGHNSPQEVLGVGPFCSPVLG